MNVEFMRIGPKLQELINKNLAYIENTEVVGIASDGEEVTLGNITNLEGVEEYLEFNPTPYDW